MLAVGAATALILAPGPAPAAPVAAMPPSASHAGAAVDDFASDLLRLINQFRAERGLPPFTAAPPFVLLATEYSQDMLAKGYFAHDTPGGPTFDQRVGGFLKREGYKRWVAAENIADGTGALDPQAVLDDWIQSPQHLANLLAKDTKQIGIGVARVDVGTGYFEGATDVWVVTGIFGPPQPKLRVSVLVTPVKGTVLVRLAGQKQFKPLPSTSTLLINVGSEVETSGGRVRLTSAADDVGNVQTGDFYQGRFLVHYADDYAEISPPQVVTDLELSGSLAGCAARKSRLLAGASAKRPTKQAKPKQRRLWGSGTGRFRTTGRYAAATVRGTTWLTQDDCTTTLVRVRSGIVDAFDFRLKRHVTLRPGQSYTARGR